MLSEFVALLALATTPVDASATPIANQTAAYVETLMEPSTIEPLPAPPPPTMSNAAQTSAAIPIDAVVQAATTPDLTEIVVTGHGRKTEADPLAGVNVISYQAVQALDKVFIGPASRVYQKVLPKPARLGINNFLLNLHEPNVFLNYLIQLKPGKAIETLGRFAINSTVGVAGLFDMAKRKPFKLPRRRNGFGNSLGYYGVKPGAFLFLPILGPTTIRDLFGTTLDRLLLPTSVGAPFNRSNYALPTGVASSLEQRAAQDDQLTKFREDSGDAYVAAREYYLTTRKGQIEALHRHSPAKEKSDQSTP